MHRIPLEERLQDYGASKVPIRHNCSQYSKRKIVQEHDVCKIEYPTLIRAYAPPPNPLRERGRLSPENILPKTPFVLFACAFSCSVCACSWTCAGAAGSVSGPFSFFDLSAVAETAGAICLPRYIPLSSSTRCGRRNVPSFSPPHPFIES